MRQSIVLKFTIKCIVLLWDTPLLLKNIETMLKCTLFFISYAFFSTQPQCCLTFSWIELQMLLRCCLVHIAIMILKHMLYLVYLYPCLGLGHFMSYLCDLFFIFSLVFIVINHTTSFKQACLFFVHCLESLLSLLDDNVDEENE